MALPLKMLKESLSTPYIPQSWGTLFRLGDTPRPPPGSILHLFLRGLSVIPSRSPEFVLGAVKQSHPRVSNYPIQLKSLRAERSNLTSVPRNDSVSSHLRMLKESLSTPYIPQSWGTFKSGGHPQTPGRKISCTSFSVVSLSFRAEALSVS